MASRPGDDRQVADERRRVLDLVHASFSLSLPWGGMGLDEADAMDGCEGPAAIAAARARDAKWTGEPWTCFLDDELAFSYSAIGVLDDASFRWFTPALLSWSLRNEEGEESCNPLHESILWQFASPRHLSRKNQLMNSSRPPSLYRAPERAAILAYLQYQADQEAAAGDVDATATANANANADAVDDLTGAAAVHRHWLALCESLD